MKKYLSFYFKEKSKDFETTIPIYSHKTEEKIKIFFEWLYKENKPVNILLKNYDNTFFKEITSFCDYVVWSKIYYKNQPICMQAYINNNKCYFEISQGTNENCLYLNDSTIIKIIIENNKNNHANIEELNNYTLMSLH